MAAASVPCIADFRRPAEITRARKRQTADYIDVKKYDVAVVKPGSCALELFEVLAASSSSSASRSPANHENERRNKGISHLSRDITAGPWVAMGKARTSNFMLVWRPRLFRCHGAAYKLTQEGGDGRGFGKFHPSWSSPHTACCSDIHPLMATSKQEVMAGLPAASAPFTPAGN